MGDIKLFAEYLKYGWVWNFDYPAPKKKEILTIDEYASKLDKIFNKSVEKIYSKYKDPLFMLSGGVDSSLCVSYIRKEHPRTISVSNWNTDDKEYTNIVSKYIGSDHRELLTENIFTPDDLIKIQSFFDHPHSRLLAFFWYLIGKGMKEEEIECDVVVTGAGPDHYMLEDVNSFIISRALQRKEYDLIRAIKYKNKLKDEYKSITYRPGKLWGDNYEDIYQWNQFPITFEDDEVKKLGVEPFTWELKENNVFNFDNLLCEAKDRTYKLYFKMIEDIFGYKFDDSVFTNKKAINIYNKIPIEAKNCLGYSKPIIRKIASNYLPSSISSRDKLDWKPDFKKGKTLVGDEYFYYPIYIESIEELVNTFLANKNYKIYQYIDYEESKKYFYDFKNKRVSSKLWNLINLSAWLEVHK